MGARRLLPAALAGFVAAHPDVELTVREAEPEAAAPMVRGGGADLALAYHFDGPLPLRGALEWTPLMDDPLWLALPPEHRLAGRDSLALAELAAERWVLGCLKTEAYLRRYAGLAGFDLRVAASTSDYFFAQTLVAAGVGVALIPQVSLAPEASVALVRVEPPRPARHIGVVTPHRRRPHAQALTAALAEAASR
ncbi:LysR substrate-binding domain-containing protein [Streptomyces sp. NPDC051109]|uniref:LysR substrate-binding domain-containing protein n=1 Tax=Streptomyces sp. NPDC051109 TaxID=3365642 RepID=UPI00379AE7A2